MIPIILTTLILIFIGQTDEIIKKQKRKIRLNEPNP